MKKWSIVILGLLLTWALVEHMIPSSDTPILSIRESIHEHHDAGQVEQRDLSRDSKVDKSRTTLQSLVQPTEILNASPYQVEAYEVFSPLTKKVLRKARYERCKRRLKQKPFTFLQLTYRSNGLKINAFMGLPEGFSPQKRYPVILFHLGGRLGLSRFHACTALLVSRLFIEHGYVVVVPQYRGVAGSEGTEEFGGAEVTDTVILTQILKQVKFIDSKNLFLSGGSRGGMMVYLALKQGAKVNAAFTYAAPVNLYRTIKDFAWFEPVVLTKLVPGFSKQRDSEIQKRSALFWPHLLHTELLILHGKKDKRVPHLPVELFCQKLRSIGRKCQLSLYPSGTHFNIYKQSRREVLTWLRQRYKSGTLEAVAPKGL